MVQPQVRNASRRTGQNFPIKPKPWWLELREARRRAKVKGVMNPGPKLGQPSLVTRPKAQSCEQHTRKPAPWWYAKRVAKREGKVTTKVTPKAGTNRGLSTTVRSVVRAVLRPLIAEFRSALKILKGSGSRVKKAEKPSFVFAGFMKGQKFKSEAKKPTVVPPSKPIVKLVETDRSVYNSSGAFTFDYGRYERESKANSEWVTLRNQLNNVVAQTTIGRSGSSAAIILKANDIKIRNLLLMYIKENGHDSLLKREHELDVLLGDMHKDIPTVVKAWISDGSSGGGTRSEMVVSSSNTLCLPETATLLKVIKDARPSEVLSLWFGENQKFALCNE